MYKSIPKSSVSKRQFKTYKRWSVDNTEYPVISASLDDSHPFIEETEVSSSVGNTTFYNKTLYKSIRSKYYNNNGSVQNTFGIMENIANYQIERSISNTIRIISVDRDKFGEQIKKGTLVLEDLDNSSTFNDDENGGLIRETFDYILVELDLLSEIVIITDGFNTFTLDVVSIDLLTGESVLIYSGTTIQSITAEFDFDEGVVRLTEELEQVGDLFLENLRYGNVFYDDGLIVFTNEVAFQNYNLIFNSTHTIHETEVLVNIDEGEFNYSQNPSATVITISGSYDFETTPITNVKPEETVKITHINDKKLKQSFSGSYNPSITGSWDDYQNYRWSDPTGSYLTPYITTIGLYDDDGDLLVIAKLPTPIKSYPDLPLNFLIRFDT